MNEDEIRANVQTALTALAGDDEEAGRKAVEALATQALIDLHRIAEALSTLAAARG